MRKTNLIICPNCQEQKVITVLGELAEDGSFTVLNPKRAGYGTRIMAAYFHVICHHCNEVVFKKEERRGYAADGFTFRQPWFYRQSFEEAFGTTKL